MEEKTLLYLQNTVASLRSAGHHETADTLTRAQEELAEAQWCEMTESILLAVRDPVVLSSAYELHESVLKVIRIDMPPIAYVKLLHSICFSPNVTLPMALELIEDAAVCLVSNSSEQGENAVSCIRALLLLDRNRVDAHGRSTEAAAQEARAILDRVETFIHKKQMHEVDPVLTALHCEARGKDYEMRLQYTKYYHNAFEIMNNTERAEMPIVESDKLKLAYDTAVAALLSEEIYNFGKLLNDKRFTARLAESTVHAWILEWLRLCNDGQVEAFELYAIDHRDQIESNPVLAHAHASITFKVRLMALLHLVFYTPFNERTFKFDVISKRCAVQLDRVEPLLLAALAKGVIIGKIDGLTEEIHITWVEPRVLSLQEVKDLAAHVSHWKEKVIALSSFVSETVQETLK